MTRRLRWTEHSSTQLGAIAEYISLTSPVYAEQVVDRVIERLRQALAFPESGRVVAEEDDPKVRELIEIPYRLIYRIREDSIEVLAIVHGRQQWHDLEADRDSGSVS